MIVVSNTSPIISLAAIGQLDLLQQLYNQIIIPRAVYNEIANVGKTDVGAAAVQTLPWIQTQIALHNIAKVCYKRESAIAF